MIVQVARRRFLALLGRRGYASKGNGASRCFGLRSVATFTGGLPVATDRIRTARRSAIGWATVFSRRTLKSRLVEKIAFFFRFTAISFRDWNVRSASGKSFTYTCLNRRSVHPFLCGTGRTSSCGGSQHRRRCLSLAEAVNLSNGFVSSLLTILLLFQPEAEISVFYLFVPSLFGEFVCPWGRDSQEEQHVALHVFMDVAVIRLPRYFDHVYQYLTNDLVLFSTTGTRCSHGIRPSSRREPDRVPKNPKTSYNRKAANRGVEKALS